MNTKSIIFKLYKILPSKLRFQISYLHADKFIVGIMAFIIKDGTLLLLKQSYQSKWGLPSGWVKHGESLSEAIEREAKEELGIKVQMVKILDVKSLSDRPIIDIAVLCEVRSPVNITIDNHEVEQAEFFPLNKLPKRILSAHFSYIQEYIDQVTK